MDATSWGPSFAYRGFLLVHSSYQILLFYFHDLSSSHQSQIQSSFYQFQNDWLLQKSYNFKESISKTKHLATQLWTSSHMYRIKHKRNSSNLLNAAGYFLKS